MNAIRSLIRAVAPAALMAALALSALPATASAAVLRTFGVDGLAITRGDGCLYGNAAPSTTLHVTWKSKSGALKASVDVATVSSGFWSYCSDTAFLAVGDTIKAADSLGSRTFTMPKITVFGDRVNDLFYGQAPANSTGYVSWQAGLFADYWQGADVIASGDGTWSYQDPEEIGDLIGGILALVTWETPQGDYVSAYGQAAYVTVTLGSSNFDAGGAYQSVMVTLRDPVTNAIKARGSNLTGTFTDDQGQPVAVQAGDRIKSKLAPDMDWIVPNIEASANIVTDHVTGRCSDNGLSSHSGVVEVYRTGLRRGFALMGTDEDGDFDVNFSKRPSYFYDPANIKRGDRIVVLCRLVTGDNVVLQFRVP